MVIFNKNKNGVRSDIGLNIRRKSGDVWDKNLSILPNETPDDFEELSDEQVAALKAKAAGKDFESRYKALVVQYVRERYDADDVEAILANGTDTEEHAAELEEYQAWRAESKRRARASLESELATEHPDDDTNK